MRMGGLRRPPFFVTWPYRLPMVAGAGCALNEEMAKSKGVLARPVTATGRSLARFLPALNQRNPNVIISKNRDRRFAVRT